MCASVFFLTYMQDVDPTSPRCSVIRDLRQSICNLAFLENPNGYIGGLSQVHTALHQRLLSCALQYYVLFINLGRFNT